MDLSNMMHVVKRNGKSQEVCFDKITNRIKYLACKEPRLAIEPIHIAQKAIERIENGITTEKLDILTAEICAFRFKEHPDYLKLASRIVISNCHKTTSPSYSETISILYNNNIDKLGNRVGLVSEDLYEFVMENKDKINSVIDYNRDYVFDYFGYKTMERSYLLKIDGKVIERPQDMIMRVSLGLHCKSKNLTAALKSYDLISQKYFTHATPTLFHSGTPEPQLFSCFLFGTHDSIHGIYKTLSDTALIEKRAGGIGIDFSCIRSKGSYIRGSNGESNGIIPALRVYNATARYVDQGGRRPGSIAIYLNLHHAEIMQFLELKFNHGNEELRTRDLFLAVMIPDLFMKRVESGEMWTLFNPDLTQELNNVYGDEYEELYQKYESQGIYEKQISARSLLEAINKSKIETGTPYCLFRDHINRKNNQANLGVIQNSNLCAEIVEYSDNKEYACCVLASIGLPRFVDEETKTFDHQKLIEVMEVVVNNLNEGIDINFYPVPETSLSNFKHRPLGIGVQGLADVYAMMDMPFDSKEAAQVNKEIFETMYYGALIASHKLAKTQGSYESFEGSPISQGKFQFDLWGVKPPTERYNWEELRQNIMNDGLRNSLLIALMPTASTAQIFGNHECFEPFTRNIYSRKVTAGSFVVINKHLTKKMLENNLWTKDIISKMIAGDGSIQHIEEIPKNIRDIFKTAYEISQRKIIEQCADRGPFVDQTQSMNLFFDEPTYPKLRMTLMLAWKLGLKTGNYYIRTSPTAKPDQVTVNNSNEVNETEENYKVCEACT